MSATSGTGEPQDHNPFARLLSPLKIGPVTLRNRIVFTAHDSLLQRHGKISDEYIAYQVARTRGGAGLQILVAAAIDPSAATSEHQLLIDTDEAIPGFRAMADAVHAHGGAIGAQLLHAGREVYSSADGTAPVTYSASATPSERFRVIPRALSKVMIREIVERYGAAARRAMNAGFDVVEVNSSQGNLPAQFLAESVNRRTDEYGGSLQNRIRLLLEACAAVRAAVGDKLACGVRLSVTDLDDVGLNEQESLAAAQALDAAGLVDFIHLVLGTAATRAGAGHIVPPMSFPAGYMTAYANKVKQLVHVPVIATGRYNTPQTAELALQQGSADACGMTRAMICDPDLGKKLLEKRPDDVRACIGCDQACIGHYQKGASISCIQFPESGRELQYATYPLIRTRRRILVAGGGPAGMKAASVAAARGHQVILYEATGKLGGQARLAERLPGREEFGGIITNLRRELEIHGVEVRRKAPVSRQLIESEKPDAIVIATGGVSATADAALTQGAQVVTADSVIAGTAAIGRRVVIADNRCDWVGIGVAEKLAAEGHQVRLAVTGIQPGEGIPIYVRDIAMARLLKAGVEIIAYARLFGADADTVYLQHVVSTQPIVLEGVDTLVVSFGQQSNLGLEDELRDFDIETHIIGDCLTPRTAEEAVLDGLKVGVLV
jgi:2,4-dienoyl-CoA reductase-like NADH-dependent reductase (Old Yellow Enzyme family)